MPRNFDEYDRYINAREQKNYAEKHLLKALRAVCALLEGETIGATSTGEMVPRDLAIAKKHIEIAYHGLTCESDLGNEAVRDWYEKAYEAKKEE